jgi:hypothetical protein
MKRWGRLGNIPFAFESMVSFVVTDGRMIAFML